MAVKAPSRSDKPSWRERALPPSPDPSPSIDTRAPRSGIPGSLLRVARLGTVDYVEAWELQGRLARARCDKRIPDMLLLLEHPHTFTLGRAGRHENILLSPSQLRRRKIAVYDVDRGGDVTYHGPGQLVGYPILRLPKDRFTFVRYIRELEQALLLGLRDLGFAGELMEGYSGVWVGEEKVCAIGVKVDACGITSHGFALNVNTDLSYFDQIIPCGIRDKDVTSLQRLVGRHVSMRRVEKAVIARIAATFDLDLAVQGLGPRRLDRMVACDPS